MIYLDYNKLGKKLTLHFVVCGRGGRPDNIGAKLVDVRDRKSCCCDDDFDLASVPASVCRVFDDQFVTGNEANVCSYLWVFSP